MTTNTPTPKTRIARSFYTRRNLPTPAAEFWPADSRELRELLRQPATPDTPPRILIGDGQHLHPELITDPHQPFDVIRTTNCSKILSFDDISGLIRAEAGITWRVLQNEAAERGFSLHHYNLYPSTATLGGLLARRHHTEKNLFFGDIREGCVALSAITPDHQRYRYIPAPRKASGPDLRYLYIGTQGAFGAILDATLIVTKPLPGRLFLFKTTGLTQTIQRARQIFARGIRPAWTHYDHTTRTLSIAVHKPEPLLQSIEKDLRTHIDAELTTLDDAELHQRRRYLEDRHPDRRSAPGHVRTLTITCDLSMLANKLQLLGIQPDNVFPDAAPHAEPPRLQIYNWTPNQALAILTYPDTDAMHLALARSTPSLPRLKPWFHTLKNQLDPHNTLATSPSHF